MAHRHEQRERKTKRTTGEAQAGDPCAAAECPSDELRASPGERADAERLNEAILSASPVAILVLNRQGTIVSANAHATRLLACSGNAGELARDCLRQVSHTHLNGKPFPDEKLPLTQAIRTRAPVHGVRYTMVFPDDRRVSVSASAVPVFDAEGQVDQVVVTIEDMTAREETRAELKRINRALRIVSACNQALVRATEESELLKTVCHSIEREGAFPLVWVGYVENDPEKSVRPVASAGREAAYLKGIRVAWDETVTGRGPVGTAIRTGKPNTVRDIATDPSFEPWRKKALSHGFASTFALPLTVAGQSIGLLILYSTRRDAFREEESRILVELAADLSYGIGALRTQEEYRRTQQKLNDTAEELKLAIAASNTGLWDWDLRTNDVYYSPEWKNQLGYDEGEIGNDYASWEKHVHPEDVEHAKAAVAAYLEKPEGEYRNEFRMRHKDGTYIWISARGRVILDENGKPVRLLGSHVDISDRKESEQQLQYIQELLLETGRLAKIGGWEFDPATGKGAWTEEVARIHEVDPSAETSAKLGLEFYHGEHRDRIENAVREAIESGTPYDLVLELVTAKGNRRWVRTIGRPILEDGKVVRVRGCFQDVTELKNAHDEVKRIARFPSENPNPVLRVDHRGIIEFANPASEVLLSSWHCRPGERLPDTLSSHISTTLREGRVVKDEIDCDGKTFLFTVAPIEAANLVNIYGFDISERKQAQEALEWSERSLGQALDLAKSAHWEFDVASGALTFSDRFYALYGTTVEREGGYTMTAEEYASRFLFPEDVHIVGDEIARAIAETDPDAEWQLEHRIRRRDGEVRVVSVWITTVKDARGQTFKTRGVNQDITEQKRAEEERSRLGIALEQAAEAVLVTDAQGAITYVNPAFERITGYLRGEVTGENPRILKSGVQDEAFYNDLWQILGRGEVWSGRLQNKKKDGQSYTAEMTISPVVDEYGHVVSYVALQRDITEQIALERRLIQSQKLEAIGTLAGGIAHDFNNILGAILGYGQLVADALPKDSEPQADMGELLKAASRATDLVRQILTFSRQTEEERQAVEIGLIVKEALKLLRPSLPATIEIRTEINDRDCAVFADPSQIHQVLMNLCTNAYHAMQASGGTLTVVVQPLSADRTLAEARPGLHEGEYVLLTVSDTGHGIAQEVLDKIFEPFFTTKPQGEGTGMGLATVHGIVTSHGGTISVYSEVGAGTTFHVYLPRAEIDLSEPSSSLETVRGGHERVLVVDDEVALVRLLERTLRQLGYEVAAVTRAEEGLAAFRADPDGFDLVITDQTMPRMTGAELAVEIKKVRPELPIIVTTGHTGEPLKEQLLHAGMAAILPKPATFADVARVVRSALDGNA